MTKTASRLMAVLMATALLGSASMPIVIAADGAASTGKININSASAAQLTELPGIGPKLAARIVEYRQKSGGFRSVQELLNVKGIGEKNLAKLQPHVSVGERGERGESAKGESQKPAEH